MTEGFQSSPPQQIPDGSADSLRYRQEVTDSVQRIMGEDVALPEEPPAKPEYNSAGHNATGGPDDISTTEVAKDQAGQVAQSARQAGTQVAGTVKEHAGQVTAEAGKQAKQLLSQAQSELTDQAAATAQRVADGLQALANELGGMADKSDQDGMATDLARQAATRAQQAAGWLADREPGALLEEVRSFARRKPGTYLAVALGAGVLAGRLTRGLTASSDGHPAGTTSSRSSDTAVPTSVAPAAQTPLTSAPSALFGTGPGQVNGSDPADAAVGYDPSTASNGLPAAPTAMSGLGATTGTQGTPRGEVAP